MKTITLTDLEYQAIVDNYDYQDVAETALIIWTILRREDDERRKTGTIIDDVLKKERDNT